MNKSEFIEKFVEMAKDKFGEDAVIVNEVVKNNDQKLTGICVKKDDVNPTYYIEHYYSEFVNVEEAFSKWVNELDSSSSFIPPFSIPDFSDVEYVKNNVFYQVVNRDMNKERLNTCPHCEVPGTDLVCLFRLYVDSNQGGVMSAVITDEILRRIQIDISDLQELAFNNTKRMFSPLIRNMSEMIPGEQVDPFPMYVISNSRMVNGATNIIYKDVLSEAADKINQNFGTYNEFYILPSSIHEVIIIPDDGDSNYLLSIVREINKFEVADNEVLSNNVYKFNLEDYTLKMIA